jgi:UDP-3-O-[3-hydroxymyristoyl] N-acetylglucosamine deacetylase
VPADSLSIDFSIHFDHPAIRDQKLKFDFSERAYDKEISRARTFGFLEDVRYLQENNLALGGSLDNAVVMDNYQVLNEDGLRYSDEFVRHKILDFLGDLALVGRPIVGAFTAEKSGHHLNNLLFKKFLADPQAWQLVSPVPRGAAETPPPRLAPQPEQVGVAVA